MGRYIYQPIIMTNYSDQEYLKRYKQSIQTGELLVDLQNYDIYVTEEGIELPIPITKNLREVVMDYIRSIKSDFNTRYMYLLRYADNIRKLKEEIDKLNINLRPSIINLDRQTTGAFYRNKYYESNTLQNLHLSGSINVNIFNDYNDISTSKYRKLVEELMWLYKHFNTELIKVNNKILNNSNLDITNANAGLRNIYNDIKTVKGILDDKLPLNSLGKGAGSLNLSKTVGKKETYSAVVDVYDFAYLNMAGSCAPGSVGQMDKYFANNHSCSTRAYIDEWTLKDGTEELQRYFLTSQKLTEKAYYTFERFYSTMDRSKGNTIDDCTFNGKCGDSYYSDNLGYKNARYTSMTKYTEQSGGYHFRPKDASIDPEFLSASCTQNSYGIWIPNEICAAGLINSPSSFAVYDNASDGVTTGGSPEWKSFDGGNSTNKRMQSAYQQNPTLYTRNFLSTTHSLGSFVKHSNASFNSAGSYSCWRMVKIVLHGTKTVSYEVDTTKSVSNSFILPLTEAKTF